MIPKLSSLKPEMYYLTQFLRVKKPGGAQLSGSSSVSLTKTLYLLELQSFQRSAGAREFCSKLTHLMIGRHWLFEEGLHSLPSGHLHGLSTWPQDMAAGFPQREWRKRERKRQTERERSREGKWVRKHPMQKIQSSTTWSQKWHNITSAIYCQSPDQPWYHGEGDARGWMPGDTTSGGRRPHNEWSSRDMGGDRVCSTQFYPRTQPPSIQRLPLMPLAFSTWPSASCQEVRSKRRALLRLPSRF